MEITKYDYDDISLKDISKIINEMRLTIKFYHGHSSLNKIDVIKCYNEINSDLKKLKHFIMI